LVVLLVQLAERIIRGIHLIQQKAEIVETNVRQDDQPAPKPQQPQGSEVLDRLTTANPNRVPCLA
jgi:hypothetical protein